MTGLTWGWESGVWGLSSVILGNLGRKGSSMKVMHSDMLVESLWDVWTGCDGNASMDYRDRSTFHGRGERCLVSSLGGI